MNSPVTVEGADSITFVELGAPTLPVTVARLMLITALLPPKLRTVKLPGPAAPSAVMMDVLVAPPPDRVQSQAVGGGVQVRAILHKLLKVIGPSSGGDMVAVTHAEVELQVNGPYIVLAATDMVLLVGVNGTDPVTEPTSLHAGENVIV
jgi:hypothetical protein